MPVPSDIDYQAEMLAAKTKHYLVTTLGRILENANDDEVYRALSYALREEIMINWAATLRSQTKSDQRMLYYLSLEYLPGRIFSNNITNLCANDILKIAIQKLNRNFSDLINREADPALGNGGLGRLASCFLDSLATHNYPSIAYGLRYQYGIFEQQLWDGMQVEVPDCWLINENPWEFRRDLGKLVVKYCGNVIPGTNIHGDEILELKDDEEVIALPYNIPIIGYSKTNAFSVVTLRLWSTKESPRNFQLQRYNAGRLDQAAENTTLTDVLYPSDYHETGKRIRLKQEFLLVSASLQDIIRNYLQNHENFRAFDDKVCIQINDTHPALVIPELIRILTKDYDIPWQMAVDMTQACTGYTNHTILSEALEQWEHCLLRYLLPRQCRIIERLNHEFCNKVRARYPDDEEKIRRMSIIENGKVRMANLAIVGSHSINGVAELHTEILKKQVFKDFYDFFPEKFFNVTNGVTQRRWLLHCNPELSKFLTQRIGDGWITDFSQIEKIADFASDETSQTEFMAIKLKKKQRLIDYLMNNNFLRDSKGHPYEPPPVIDAHSLFEVQIKRIHEYKRQLLNVLHLVMLYQDLLENPFKKQVKRTAIISGKAAASYDTAKNIIRFISCVARKINHDPNIHGMLKIIFVENYNVTKAEYIIPAADLSVQISTAGMEASGTGNMKLAINGALTIGTEDGANIEMHQKITDAKWPFSFGCSSAEIDKLRSEMQYNPHLICANNEKIRKAVDTLRDGTFAISEEEHQAFYDIYRKLLEDYSPDKYFVLQDLQSYYDAQNKAEHLYQDPHKWAEMALYNIAGMGSFSADVSVSNYCKKIWHIEPLSLDPLILERIRYEYSEHDKCRIY